MLRTKLNFIVLILVMKIIRLTNSNQTENDSYPNNHMLQYSFENLSNSDNIYLASIEYIDKITAEILEKTILDTTLNQETILNQESTDYVQDEANLSVVMVDEQTNTVQIIRNDSPLSDHKNTTCLYPFVSKSDVKKPRNKIKLDNEPAKFICTIYLIENNYHIKFLYLINHLNINRVGGIYRTNNHVYYNNSRDKFYSIITANIIKESQEVKSLEDLEFLYKEFRNFKFEVWKTYNIENIIKTHLYSIHYKMFFDGTNKDVKKSKEEVFQLYIDAFNSENYNILLKIFPGFEFIYKILIAKNLKCREVAVIKLLQLIICKFEAFRSQYFFEHPNNYVSLKVLESNFLFKETIAIISVIFKGVMEMCYLTDNFIKVLEIYSFAFFIRAKYPNTFKNIEYFKSIVNLKDSKIECIDDLHFDLEFVSSLFYMNLDRIINQKDLVTGYTMKLGKRGQRSSCKKRSNKMGVI